MFRRGRMIVNEVEMQYGLYEGALISGIRTRTLAHARAEAARRLRMETDLSWAEIGAIIGRKSAPRTKEYFATGRLST